MKDEQFPFFCPAAPGLEDLVLQELTALGVKAHREEGGAFWKGGWRELFRASLCLRAASRILIRVRSFSALTFFDLESAVRGVPWERWIHSGRPFRVRVTCRKSKLYHAGAVEERFQHWISKQTGASPLAGLDDEDDETGAQLVVVRFFHDRCTVSVDTSGELLHRRGYRQALAKAPLRETLAWGLLASSGWTDNPAALTDPFCGSGTIPIEAALFARKIPPGLARPNAEPRAYAFQSFEGYDQEHWEKTVASLKKRILPASPVPLAGSDRDEGAIQASLANAERAGVAADISFSLRSFSEVRPPQNSHLVTNPPYGIRVSEGTDLRNLFASLGRLARDRTDLTISWLCSENEWMRATGYSWHTKNSFSNGGIGVKVLSNRP